MNLSFKNGVASIDWEKDEDPLTSAIILSIYCERGYWGDLLEDHEQGIGSLIWTLKREPKSQETMHKLKGYLEDCLGWMITDGWAEKIDSKVSIEGKGINILVLIDGSTREFTI